MAEYIVQSESLTAIADKIRVLSGTESAMGLDDMATHVGEANMDIATQADLIAQIKSTVDNLPEAGSGGGSVSYDTCTVTLSTTSGTFVTLSGTTCVNNELIPLVYNGTTSETLNNVLCGSTICAVVNIGYIGPCADYTGTSEIYSKYVYGNKTVFIFKAPTVAGESCTITMYDDD